MDDRVKLLVEALQVTCIAMDSIDDSAWIASLGRSTSHVTGPLATISRLGLVRRSSTRGGLRLGNQLKTLVRGSRAIGRIGDKLAVWVRVSDDVAAIMTPAKTCSEWMGLHGRVVNVFKRHGMFKTSRSGSYLLQWSVRALMMAEMRRAGVRSLHGKEEVRTNSFAAAFPDSKSWMMRLQCRGLNGSLGEFLRSVSYSGPP